MAAVQHLAKHPVGIVAALVGALGVFVVHPREHDHLAGRVVAKEEPLLLEELRPEPVLVIVAKGAALSVFSSGRVLRDDVEGEPGDRRQPLAGVLLHIPDRVFLPEGLDLLAVPSDPHREEYRQGNTMGPAFRHWRRAKIGRRFRRFFRFDSRSKIIIFAWVNDENTLRASGSQTHPYAVFQRMSEKGHPPDDWAMLASPLPRDEGTPTWP